MHYDLLLSDEEYQKKYEGRHIQPYKFEILGKNKTLFYFGVSHSRNQNDKQWPLLKDYWRRFLTVAGKKKIVFLEGPKLGNMVFESSEAGIKKFGERWLILNLAKDAGVPVHWPDPTLKQETVELEKKFDKDLVQYFIFARSAGSWIRSGMEGGFDEIVKKAVISTANRIGAPSGLQFYGQIHQKLFGKIFTDKNQKALIEAAVPVKHNSIINDVARASSRFRNKHVVSEVDRYWSEGYSIFMLFGSAHAVIQERALKSLSDI